MRYSNVLLISLLLLISACIPEPDPYPYRPGSDIRAEAQAWSDDLTTYIEGWLDGQNPSLIPDSLILDGITDADSFYLVHPDSVTFREIWGWRERKPVNLDSLYNGVPDPHATYLLLGPAFAPFGSQVHIEGEFPHCRFFSIQMSPSLSGEEYCSARYFGPTEVPIVDADIEPLPGHVNPFRAGANRNASQRSYHVTYDLAIGNAVSLSNGDFAPPYRSAGNNRIGGLIQYQGPWGVNGGFGGITPGSGEWNIGSLWIRMYAPDDNTDAFGGVGFPKVYYTLPDGRPYYIAANFDVLQERADQTMAARETYTPENNYIDASNGWTKSFGILRSILEGVSEANGWTHPDSLSKIRAVDLGATGRGQYAGAPANYEPSATGNNYVNYLGKFLRLDTGRVAVLTGKIPTFPRTRSGQSIMTTAECRYFSITGYDNDPFAQYPGSATHSVMDEDILLDNDGNYIICYSRPEDRPTNATAANGITWINWGPTMDQGLIARYLSVANGWDFDQTPDEIHLPWSVTNFASPNYDTTLLYENWHNGWMDCYVPRTHVMATADFQALGTQIDVEDVPIWVHDKYELGLSDAANMPIRASSTYDNSGDYGPEKANDLDLGSAWGSRYLSPVGPEWLEVDLGIRKRISAVKISWQLFAHAVQYQLQVSDDQVNWTDIVVESSGNGGIDVWDRLQVSGRYVRIYMTQPAVVTYGIHFFEVYSPDEGCLRGTATQIQEFAAGFDFKVYPNPFVNELRVQVDSPGKMKRLEVWDTAGQRVWSSEFREEVTLSWLPAGAYFVKVVDHEGAEVVRRVVKQK